MPNVLPFILAFIYVLVSILFLFYFGVCLVRTYVCCVDVLEIITTDLTDRAKKKRRVHCIIIEFTPEANVVESRGRVPFSVVVPDAVEIEED
jgi:hypothetical protein